MRSEREADPDGLWIGHYVEGQEQGYKAGINRASFGAFDGV